MTAIPWFFRFAAPPNSRGDTPRVQRAHTWSDVSSATDAIAERAASHRKLVDRIRAGDESAFETMFREFYLPLCDYVVSLGQTADTSEDIVEELFLKLWASRSEFTIHGSLSSYLHVAARHQALNYAERERTAVRAFDRAIRTGSLARETVSEAESSLDAADHAAILQRAVASLPIRSRRVFLLYYRDGLSYAEIAEQLSVARKTIENHLARALKLLSVRLKQRLR